MGILIEFIEHPRVMCLSEKGEAANDSFMQSIYDEKVDYLVKSFHRYYALERILINNAWSNSGVLEQV